MKHLEQDIVSTLKRLLDRDYFLSSIFKEIIQNADDARAQHLHFGWIADWPDGVHPLLNQPVLIALNDGPFSGKDENSITKLGQSGKARDVGTIGTFGLGMKSVFHLCEGFFYAASANQEALDGLPFVEFLTPWQNFPHIKSWMDHEDRAAEIIMEKLSFWGNLCDRWFCILIPMRKQEHLGAPGAIVDLFPEVENFFPNKPVTKIIHCFTPLLKSLEEITFWDWNSNTGSPDKKWGMSFDGTDLKRTRFPDRLEPGVQSPIGGTAKIVTFSPEETSTEYSFGGYETLLSDSIFNEIKTKIEHRKIQDIETGEYVSPKAYPHCGVMFCTGKSILKKVFELQIERAAFLPLSQAEECLPVEGKREFRLTLQGGYFLDPGRQAVTKRSESDRGIEEQWNDSIDELGVWPLILPSLSKFIEDSELGFFEVNNLTQSLQESQTFSRNKQFICNKYQWLKRISDQDRRWGQWELLDHNREYLILPKPGKGLIGIPFEVFPNLPTISAEHVLVFAEQPLLTTKEPGSWDYGSASNLLRNLGATALESDQGMQYLCNFLDGLDDFIHRQLSSVCAQSVMKLIEKIGIDRIGPNQNRFVKLLEKLPEEYWVSLDLSSEILAKLTKVLSDLELNQILLPETFQTRGLQCGKLTQSTADKMLKWLAHDPDLDVQSINEAALAILDKTDGKLNEKREKLGDYKLFRSISYPDKIEYTASWNELHKIFSEGHLFTESGLKNSGFVYPFSKAVSKTKFYSLIGSGGANPLLILFQQPEQLFYKNQCLKILSRCPDLESPDDRRELLDTILKSIKSDYDITQVKAIRYLLHGKKDKFEDTGTHLWTDSNSGNETFRNRIAREAVNHLPNHWRIVPKVLAEYLNPRQKKQLNILGFDESQLEDLIYEQRDLSWMANLNLSPEERWELLKTIKNDDILRRLPIHKTVDGEFVSINSGSMNNMFLISRDQFRVSSDTEGLVRLLERPDDESAAYRCKRLIQNQEWTPSTALQTALSKRSPSWKDILTALGSLKRQPDDPTYLKLIETCRGTLWIPTSGGLRAPRDLIRREDKEKTLSLKLLAGGLKQTFFVVSEIDPECREHEYYETILRLLVPSDEETLERIGACLKKDQDYSIGNLSQRIDESDFINNFLFVFSRDHTKVMPTGSIVKVLLDAGYRPNAIKKHILGPLTKHIDNDRLKEILNFCKTIHEQADQNDKPKIISVFNLYLATLAENPSHGSLYGLYLLNREGQWKPSTEICLNRDGIMPSNLLDVAQTKVLKNLMNTKAPVPLDFSGRMLNESKMESEGVAKYFEQFEEFVPAHTIGAFLSLFGDEEYIKTLAEDYLHPEKIGEFRSTIDWTPRKGLTPNYTDVDDDNIHDVMDRRRFTFLLSSPDGSCYVPSIAGDYFKAQLSTDYSNLFVRHFQSNNESETWRRNRLFTLTLRVLGNDELEGKDVSSLLIESARYLLTKVYNRNPKHLDSFEGQEKIEQLKLQIAQRLILNHFNFYFKQLGEKRLSNIRELLTKWRELEIRKEQIKIETSFRSNQALQEINGDFDRLRMNLREKLEEDGDVQYQLLEVVRRKIREDYQYMADSIPFELFQNADDASKELFQMGKTNRRVIPDIFYMYWDEFSLVFVHLGRQINQFRSHTFSSKEGEAAGYNSDLEKMLVMSYSDKSDQNCKVTGKFGLGFKSVFLVSSQPKVLSGQLGFEVVAGMYPKRLNQSVRARLKDKMKGMLNNYDGTIFEIGFDETISYPPRKVNERFLKLLPVILIFSRQIKKCVLQDHRGHEEALVHSEEPISNCPGAFVTNMSFPFNGDIGDCNALVLRTEDFGALLLNLNTNGIGKFSEMLPTFWNLAPLGKEGLGFAVNGNFLLDVGRAQIAEPIERHEEVSKEIGLALGEVLIHIHEASESNWPSLRENLGFSPEVTAYQMWESVWRLLGSDLANETSGQKRERDLCKQIFWQTGRGMAELFENKDAIPSGLHGDYKQLTSLKKIRWCAEGRLDSDEKVFNIVSSWETFRSHIPAKGNDFVSKSHIKLPLERLMSKKFEWNCVNIEKVLKWELSNYPDVSPDQAEKLGTIITPQFMNTLDKTNDSARQEYELLAKGLKGLRFRAASGAFVSCHHLLVSDHEDKEESMKAAFAPLESVLDSNHGAHAIAFFRACRGPIEVSVDTMEQWAVKPLNVAQQKAFLKYLIREDQGWEELQKLIGDSNPKSWFQDLSKTQAYKELEIHDRDKLNSSICESVEFDDVEFEDYSEMKFTRPKVQFTRPDALVEIYDWWEKERNNKLDKYEQKIYPKGQFFILHEDTTSGQYNKKEWLKMFLLGCLQTVGRTTHEQKRDFVERSDRLIGELVHCETEPSNWLRTFDQIIERQIDHFPDYRSNLMLFGMYVIGRRLTDYIDLITSVNRFPPRNSISMRQIMAPRASANHQRGGIDAPPINRVLGIGGHFLLRELYRNGILTHEGLHRQCYVPNERLRILIEALGCSNINEKNNSNEDRSRIIFDFLSQKLDSDRALFKKDFDVPLQIIAYDRELQKRYIGKELPIPTYWA